MIYLGIPVVEQHSLTHDCINYLSLNCSNPESVEIIVIDNGSRTPYMNDWSNQTCYHGVKITTIRNEINLGFYYPLLQIAARATAADLVGLQHNDLFHYEKGWDRRVLNSFVLNPRLGCLGVCGSSEVDDRGGRGGGTVCNFRGERGQLQEHTGRRITTLEQALVLDSMFMLFRRPIVDALAIDEHIPPCHFYDKIWPMRTIHAGWFVGVLGLEVDHQGGLTSTGTRFEQDCELWCQKEHLPFESGKASLVVYLEAERQWLTEGRNTKFVPSHANFPWQPKL